MIDIATWWGYYIQCFSKCCHLLLFPYRLVWMNYIDLCDVIGMMFSNGNHRSCWPHFNLFQLFSFRLLNGYISAWRLVLGSRKEANIVSWQHNLSQVGGMSSSISVTSQKSHAIDIVRILTTGWVSRGQLTSRLPVFCWLGIFASRRGKIHLQTRHGWCLG